MDSIGHIYSARTAHSIKRMRTRVDEAMSYRDLLDIVRIITTGDRKLFIERQSIDKTDWLVSFKDRILRVIYDEKRMTLATVMKPQENHLEMWREKFGSTPGTEGFGKLGSSVRISKLR